MDKTKLRRVVSDQAENFNQSSEYILRAFNENILKTRKISVITGVRRCGKSTLLKIFSKNFKKYGFLNFEDERLLNFSYKDFDSLLEIYYEIYGVDLKTFFFDEIQNVYGWEKFVSRMYGEGKKVFITGSNSKLLSSELSSSITGRHISEILYPFSFREFLDFKNYEVTETYSTKDTSLIIKYFSEFLKYGGFPEVVMSKDKDELIQLYQDILIKDIIVRHRLKDTKAFRELSHYLLSNICTKYSYNNLSGLLHIKSPMSIKNYIGYLEDAYLYISIPKFDYSIKKQIANDRKVYVIDTGIYNAVAFSFSENRGKVLENFALTELLRKKSDIFYFKEKYECDFLLKTGNIITQAIQVTDNLSDINTKEREIRGLLEAMNKFKIKDGLILTYDLFDEFKYDGKIIKALPIWHWLLFENSQ